MIHDIMKNSTKGLLGLIVLLATLLAVTGACTTGQRTAETGIKRSVFGKMPDGQQVDLYTLTNANGMQVGITNYGGRIVSILVPDRHGKMADVVLGFDNLQGYLDTHTYFGALMRTGLAAPNSHWMARFTSCPSTTGRTACTVASKALTRKCGQPVKSRGTSLHWS